MSERRVAPEGWQATIRNLAFFTLVGCAIAGCAGYLLSGRRLDDLGWVPPALLAAIAVVALLVWIHTGYGGGIFAGVVAAVGAVVTATAAWVLDLFHLHACGTGDDAFWSGVIALFVGGFVMVFLDAILWFTALASSRNRLPLARILRT